MIVAILQLPNSTHLLPEALAALPGTTGAVLRHGIGIALYPLTAVALPVTLGSVFGFFGKQSNVVELLVKSELETASIFVYNRGKLSLAAKNVLLKQTERIMLDTFGFRSTFGFAGGLSSGESGMSLGSRGSIGRIEMAP